MASEVNDMGDGDRERISPSFRYIIFVCILSAVLMSVLNIFYTNWVDQTNRGAWCDLLTLIDEQSQTPTVTPRTEAQLNYFRLIHDLRQKQGCK